MQLAGYSNLIKIGEGGMAEVYHAIQDSLQRPVAIKLLNQGIDPETEAHRRFERESIIISRLSHPNIVQVIDRGISTDKRPYFVMEYVNGGDIGQAALESMSHEMRIDIVVQLLKALAYAHKNNVVHRDIKPENILIDAEGTVKVLDFGIAQFCEGCLDDSSMTRSGTVMGTYHYMSPEQQRDPDSVTARSDLYSVGVIMYGLFTGKVPSGSFEEPYRLNDKLCPALNELIMDCLNPDPNERPASAEQLKSALLALSQGRHLQADLRVGTQQALAGMNKRFHLLDILRSDELAGTYLCQARESGNFLIIKERRIGSPGYETNNQLAALSHPCITATLGTFRNNQLFFVVQEYLQGGTLQDKLAFKLEWRDTLSIGKAICEALLFAHNNQLVHRHLRPDKVLFSATGEVKLVDFDLHDDRQQDDYDRFYYPDRHAEPKSADIYAAGVLLYQLFTGYLPRRKRDSGLIRREFSGLPADIQDLLSNMLSLAQEHRHSQSLQRGREIFLRHLECESRQPFTAHPLHDKNQHSGKSGKARDPLSVIRAVPVAVINQLAIQRTRMNLLFAVLVMVFAQYIFLFDGQEKIYQSMPAAYSAVGEFTDFAGSSDVSGSNQLENGRPD